MTKLGRFLNAAMLSLEMYGSGACLGAALLLVLVEVVGRSAFSFSLGWAEELVRYLIIWSTFLGAAFMMRKYGHIRVGFLADSLPERQRLVLDMVASAVGCCFCLFLVIQGGESVVNSIRLGETSPTSLQAPVYLVRLAVPVGAFMIGVHLVRRVRLDAGLMRSGATRAGHDGPETE